MERMDLKDKGDKEILEQQVLPVKVLMRTGKILGIQVQKQSL